MLVCAAPALANNDGHDGSGSTPVDAYAVGSTVGSGSSQIYRINEYATDPVADVIVDSGLYLGDIGINPSSGDAFVIEGHAPGRLFHVDLATGTLDLVGSSGLNGLNSLEVAADGTIYARAFNSSLLWTLDPQTATPAVLVDTLYSGGGDLALSPTGEALYATADAGSGLSTALMHIDLETAAVVEVADISINQDTEAWAGIDFDPDGNLFGFLGHDNIGLAQVYSIDLDNYGATLVGDVVGAEELGLLGAAIPVTPPVPEPASLALMLAASLLLRRR